VPTAQRDTFRRIAPWVADSQFRANAVNTLLSIPTQDRDPQISASLLDLLVKHAETTPAAKRTTNAFLRAMQLADQLLTRLPSADARVLRNRLREVSVRVVLIHTVEEEMRYDLSYFAVESGRPVQIVLNNEDLMPHNLVITASGALKEVAQQGLLQGPNPGFQGKPYVPQSDKVLFATGMVGSNQQERLTFTAPSQPGEYPFVCTFPRHWMRMYGVMVVVDDLDAWLRNPSEPKDPIGSNRRFVKSWKVEDFAADLNSPSATSSSDIGQRLFKEATCAQCHKVHGQGGAVGPELSGVLQRWKGDRLAVLREILDPSHRIDAKYAVHVIVTTEGKVLSGIVKASDKTSVSIMVNPESPSPTVVLRADIDDMVRTSKSMMPKALLDRFTKAEVLELLAYMSALKPHAP
jgi:putative heme-binding domain-containing protein